MLTRIIDWSLRHRGLVLAAWATIGALGVASFAALPLDAFPDTTPVQVQVNTVAPALGPLEVERQLTVPIEQAISGLPGLVQVRSLSRFGLSQVTLVFADGTDIWLARQTTSERLLAVDLPRGLQRPELGPVATGLGEVFHYLVRSNSRSPAELRTLQDWVIAPQLRGLAGVAEVNSWGGDEREIQVRIDPARLHKYDLTLDALAAAIEANNANAGGGPLDLPNGASKLIQGVGLVSRVRDVENIVVKAHEGRALRVGDVARVVDARAIRRGAVTVEGEEAVLGLGFMMMGDNSHEVTRRLEVRLAEVVKTLPSDVSVEVVYERTDLVDHVLDTVRTNLLEAALLVVAVLFMFLGSLRAGLIVALAIPLSLLFAFDLMLQAGVAGSLMSLGAIDFGLVVDSSVILVENGSRHLAEDQSGRSRLEIVRDAAIEVRKPTLFGELIIMIVYLPILGLEGVEGKLFRPMALTVIFALAGSVLLSMTLMPVLASLFLPRRPRHREPWLVRGLKALYRPVLRTALRFRGSVVALALLVLGNGVWLATDLGSEFVPKLREGALVINTVRLSGVTLDESVRYGARIERLLDQKFPHEIEHIWTRTGAPEVATDPMGVELSDVFITLTPREQWTRATTQDELVAEMRRELEVLPGMRFAFMQPIEMRVNEMGAGIRSDLGVVLFGDDLDLLKSKARQIEQLIKAIPGAADVVTEQLSGQPVLQITVDRDKIAPLGLNAADVLRAVEALGAIEVGELQDGERRFPIVLRMDDRYRTDEAAIGRILVAGATGQRVPLASVSKIETVESPATIQRESGKRRVVVQANVRDRDLGSFVAEVDRQIAASVDLPTGSFVRYSGQFEHLERARERLYLVVPAALLLILGLLYATYRRALDVARVFVGIPFAAVGGVVALWARDLPFSISAAVGFVALAGVAVLGDMVLVSTFRQLVARGRPIADAIHEASLSRLRPVLMTALVAGLGFLPMALNTGLGAEVQRPLATVVIGGVVSSTLLTLVVLPVLFSLFGARTDAGDLDEPSSPSAGEGEVRGGA